MKHSKGAERYLEKLIRRLNPPSCSFCCLGKQNTLGSLIEASGKMKVSVTRQVPDHIETLAPYRQAAVRRLLDEFGIAVSPMSLRVVSVSYTRAEINIETMTVTFEVDTTRTKYD